MNVVFLIYNRPEFTARVVRCIFEARPARLFVIADGPKSEADGERCRAARAVVDELKWECEVIRNYAETNLGCRRRVTGGLDWVFDQVEEAIILEDDCVPDPSFFPFCRDMLEYFREDARVGHISGDNFQGGRRRTPYSYYFSRYSSSWGWATWRRAWAEFDPDIRLWPELAAGKWHYDMFPTGRAAEFFAATWDSACDGNTHIWDAQWLFSQLAHGSLTVVPAVNLVTNVGWGPGGTYTKDSHNSAACIGTECLTFPIRHPPFMVCDGQADRYFVEKFMVGPGHPVRELRRRLGNRHFYGKLLRQVPIVGDAWARMRSGRSESSSRAGA